MQYSQDTQFGTKKEIYKAISVCEYDSWDESESDYVKNVGFTSFHFNYLSLSLSLVLMVLHILYTVGTHANNKTVWFGTHVGWKKYVLCTGYVCEIEWNQLSVHKLVRDSAMK